MSGLVKDSTPATAARFPHTKGPPESPWVEVTVGSGPLPGARDPPPSPAWGEASRLSAWGEHPPWSPPHRGTASQGGRQSFAAGWSPCKDLWSPPAPHLGGCRAPMASLEADHGGGNVTVPEAAVVAHLRVQHGDLQLLQRGREPAVPADPPARQAALRPGRWHPPQQPDEPPRPAQRHLPLQLRAGAAGSVGPPATAGEGLVGSTPLQRVGGRGGAPSGRSVRGSGKMSPRCESARR